MLTKNARKIVALRAARKLVSSGRERFICLALQTVAQHSSDSTSDACHEVMTLISKRLGRNASTLESWLFEVHGIDNDHSCDHRDKCRVTRLAWIDSLIEEHRGAA